MYIEYIIYNFSTTIRPHICDSWNITPKTIEKIMQCPSMKSPPLCYGSEIIPKKNIIMHSLLNKCKKTHFLNGISITKFKIIFFPRLNWCISISYTIKKTHSRIPLTTLVKWNIYGIFQNLWQVIFCHKYTPYVQILWCLLNFSK